MIKDYINKITCGDALECTRDIEPESIDLIITSPPYFGCRVYGNETLERETDPREYVENILTFTNEFKRVLHSEGLNIGDVYFGSKGFIRNQGKYARKTDKHYKTNKIVKPDGRHLQYKQLLMTPERIAIGMQEQEWILRKGIIYLSKKYTVLSAGFLNSLLIESNIPHFCCTNRYRIISVKNIH